MKTFVGSVGLIRHPDHGEQQWLAKFSPETGQYRMWAAERLDGETFRDCIDREIAWDLGLTRNRDYLLASMSRLHIEEIVRLPTDAEETFYILEFFVVDLYGKTSRERIDNLPDVRWVTGREVLHGCTAEGDPLDPHLVTLISKFELISPHAG